MWHHIDIGIEYRESIAVHVSYQTCGYPLPAIAVPHGRCFWIWWCYRKCIPTPTHRASLFLSRSMALLWWPHKFSLPGHWNSTEPCFHAPLWLPSSTLLLYTCISQLHEPHLEHPHDTQHIRLAYTFVATTPAWSISFLQRFVICHITHVSFTTLSRINQRHNPYGKINTHNNRIKYPQRSFLCVNYRIRE